MIEMAELYRVEGMEVARLQAQAAARFPRHTHAEYVVGANLSGSEQIWVDGREFTANAHSVTVYNPEAVQASTFDTTTGSADFVSLYIEPQRLATVAAENGWRTRAVAPELNQGAFSNAAVLQAILACYRAARQPLEGDVETAMLELTAALLANGATCPAATTSSDTQMLGRVLDYLRAHLDAPIGLEQLAAIGNVSKHHLIRTFKAAVGMPPLAYHMQLRLIEARRRLRLGRHIQDVALGLGFYDLSHFSNAFRKVMGISPLRFAVATQFACPA